MRVPEGFTCDCFDGYRLDMTRMSCVGEGVGQGQHRRVGDRVENLYERWVIRIVRKTSQTARQGNRKKFLLRDGACLKERSDCEESQVVTTGPGLGLKLDGENRILQA